MYVSLLSCIVVILRLLPPVVSMSSPGALTREVGQEVVFMFNASNRILGFNWGIRDGNTDNLKQGLINYDTQAGMKLDDKINSSSYAGRVSFVGDLSKNQAWFKIINLNINDTNQYMARIFTQGSSGYTNLPVRLNVVMPLPTTTAFFKTSTIRTDIVSVESTTTIVTTKATFTSDAPSKNYSHNEPVASDSKCTSIIATSVTINVLLVLVVVILIMYILMRKRNTERRANARLTNVKDEELGVYENAHQIEETPFGAASKTNQQPSNTGKEIYETIHEENASQTIKSHRHRRENDTVGTSLEPVVVNKSHSAMQPQHYQELKRANIKPSVLYESLEQRNMGNNGNKMLKEPATYEPLQPNKVGTEYQSLNNPIKSYPNNESKE